MEENNNKKDPKKKSPLKAMKGGANKPRPKLNQLNKGVRRELRNIAKRLPPIKYDEVVRFEEWDYETTKNWLLENDRVSEVAMLVKDEFYSIPVLESFEVSFVDHYKNLVDKFKLAGQYGCQEYVDGIWEKFRAFKDVYREWYVENAVKWMPENSDLGEINTDKPYTETEEEE